MAKLAVCLALVKLGESLDNGLSQAPPMGYNTWNDLGCKNMNEANIKAVANTLVDSGLRDAGFVYLNLDDCWMAPNRDASGRLQGNPETFPTGMKALADYIHSKGLKFGIYSDRGSATCQGLPASLGSEELDAQTFAEWDVDYLKHDNCHSSTGPNDKDQLFKEFGLMRDGLNATGRPIFYSVCGGGDNKPWSDIKYYASDPRGGGALANSWRISSDVVEWQSCQLAYLADAELTEYGSNGGFNDPDMLLGSSDGSARSLTSVRSRSQFNLWAILMAPLMIGANIRELDAYDLATYTNKEVIAVNQDPMRKQGRLIVMNKVLVPQISTSIWARELASGNVALLFMNNLRKSSSIVCGSDCWSELPFEAGAALDVRDLWSFGPAETASAVAGQDYQVDLSSGNGKSSLLIFSARIIV